MGDERMRDEALTHCVCTEHVVSLKNFGVILQTRIGEKENQKVDNTRYYCQDYEGRTYQINITKRVQPVEL